MDKQLLVLLDMSLKLCTEWLKLVQHSLAYQNQDWMQFHVGLVNEAILALLQWLHSHFLPNFAPECQSHPPAVCFLEQEALHQ